MTARKIYQIVAIEAGPEMSILYVRLDNGEVWRCRDFFDFDRMRDEWIRIPDPPGSKPFSGNNGGPELDDEPRRRRYRA